jgi:hypothetical protein
VRGWEVGDIPNELLELLDDDELSESLSESCSGSYVLPVEALGLVNLAFGDFDLFGNSFIES